MDGPPEEGLRVAVVPLGSDLSSVRAKVDGEGTVVMLATEPDREVATGDPKFVDGGDAGTPTRVDTTRVVMTTLLWMCIWPAVYMPSSLS
jgi:hypothetical protein